MTATLVHKLYCMRTGVLLGTLDLATTAGHAPYLSHWQEMVCYHPLFSLTPYNLVDFMKWEWKRLGKDVVNEQATEREETNLRVGFVALLHNLGSIDQDRDAVGLPDISTVQSNLESLLSLSAWFNYLHSKRFTFPRLHISRLNDNTALQTIHDYLEACWQKKKDYEQGKNDAEEKERLQEAERAIVAIRNSFYKPNSKKHLWKWIKGILPAKWKNDEWMGTIFTCNNADVADWDFDEIELLEEIILSSLPLEYSSINFAVRERIVEIKAAWKEHYETFTIEEDAKEFVASLTEELGATPEPQVKDYPSKGEYFVAKARWMLANPTSYAKKVDQQITAARTKLDDDPISKRPLFPRNSKGGEL